MSQPPGRPPERLAPTSYPRPSTPKPITSTIGHSGHSSALMATGPRVRIGRDLPEELGPMSMGQPQEQESQTDCSGDRPCPPPRVPGQPGEQGRCEADEDRGTGGCDVGPGEGASLVGDCRLRLRHAVEPSPPGPSATAHTGPRSVYWFWSHRSASSAREGGRNRHRRSVSSGRWRRRRRVQSSTISVTPAQTSTPTTTSKPITD
jgi:hypothetical protein